MFLEKVGYCNAHHIILCMPDALTYFLSYSDYCEIFVKTDGVILLEMAVGLAASISVFNAFQR